MHASLSLPLRPASLGNILVTDALGVTLYANEGIAEQTGFSVAEIIDSKPGQLWGGQMPRSFYDRMWQSLRTSRTPFVGTVVNRTKSGRHYPDLLAVAPLTSADGTIAYLALRPPSSTDHEQFLEEWRRIFRSHMLETTTMLPWLKRWFPESVTAATLPGTTALDWIEAQWVRPLRSRFQRRLDDRTLIEAAQRDPSQFCQLYAKYYPTIQRYFARHLPDQNDQVQDLTQDTFVRAFERLDGFEFRNAAYGTYLLRIAHHLLLNSYRHASMLELSPALSALPETSSSPGLTWIWETPELSVRERLVLSAYYRDGFSIREISRGLEISENATKLVLSRARKKLRPLLGSV